MATADITSLVEENLTLRRRLHDGEGPPCAKPWVGLEERGIRGRVKPCCWYRGAPQGAIRDGADILPIWTGVAFGALRQRMRDGAPPDCPPSCPVLASRPHWFGKVEVADYSEAELATFDAAFLANRAAVLRAMLAGADDMTGRYPLRLHLHPSDLCNLRCVMCYLDLDAGGTRDWYAGPHLPALLPYLEEIKVFGGEPFFCETSRALILETPKPRWTHTSFVTNGTLVTPRVIDALEGVRIGYVDVSLDAAGAPTYERIRLRGRFDKALAGARRLVELSRRHAIRRFPVYADFVIQELNYREMEGFIGLCAELGLVPNLSALGDTREAALRGERTGSEVGAPPRDRTDLMIHFERALARADGLRLDFAVASLLRARDEIRASGG